MTAQLPAGVRGIDGRHTIDEIVPSVAAAMGVTSKFDNTLGVPASDRYVVFLVDGMGLEMLDQYRKLAPFLAACTLDDSVVTNVPSTTATSLTSLGTGVRPGAHGMVGYTTRVPESGERINLLKWDRDVDPAQWQPVPTALEQIQAAGVQTSSVNDAKFANTALTTCSQRGVQFHGVKSSAQRHDTLVEVISASDTSLAYGYESRLDSCGHSDGVGSMQWCEALSQVDSDLADLRRDLPADCVLLITADHGMINLPSRGRFDVDNEPELLTDVTLLAGEARFRHVYTPHAADVAARWAERLGDRAVVVTREEAIELDWFGPVSDQVLGRLGDVMVASVGDFAVFSSLEFGVELKMIGFHGSVSEAELRIPVLLA